MIGRSSIAFGLALCASCALLAAELPPAHEPGVTTGEFLVEIARIRDLPAGSPRQAADQLRASGCAIAPIPLDRPLTEGDVVAISVALGIRVTTSTPTAPFTPREVDAFLAAFSRELGRKDPAVPRGRSDDNGNGADPATKGKGLKKGLGHRSDPNPR